MQCAITYSIFKTHVVLNCMTLYNFQIIIESFQHSVNKETASSGCGALDISLSSQSFIKDKHEYTMCLQRIETIERTDGNYKHTTNQMTIHLHKEPRWLQAYGA